MIEEPRPPEYRVGIGTDIHRIVEGRKLMLGGVHIPFPAGLLGHSDGDVALHAVVDALLGAAGLGFVVWSNVSLLVAGKGGPADVFGVAISPRTRQLVTSGPYQFSIHH